MTPVLRICILAGCAGLSLLDAPRAGALLIQGVAGPYRERAAAPAPTARLEPASQTLRRGPAGPVGLTAAALLWSGRAGSQLLLAHEDPRCMGLPRGL